MSSPQNQEHEHPVLIDENYNWNIGIEGIGSTTDVALRIGIVMTNMQLHNQIGLGCTPLLISDDLFQQLPKQWFDVIV